MMSGLARPIRGSPFQGAFIIYGAAGRRSLDLNHDAAGNKVMYRPLFRVEADGEKGKPSQHRLEKVPEKSLYDIDTPGRIGVIPYPDLFYILSQGAAKDDEQGLIDCPDAKEQDDPDPVGGIVIEQRGKYEHEHDDEGAIDKDRLYPVQQEGVVLFWDIVFC